MRLDDLEREAVPGVSAAERTSYGGFIPPHERVITTDALARDYARLAETTSANPSVAYYIRYARDGRAHYGVLEGNTIYQLDAHYFAGPSRTGETVSLDEVRLLAPLDPNLVSKVFGAAMNTIAPDLAEVPAGSHPRWFTKFPTSITGPGGGIEVAEDVVNLVHEAELVLVIGQEGRHLSVEEAADHIWGVTVGNDITEFSWYFEEGGRETPSKPMGKSMDTFSPIGPAIAVGLDYSDLQITHRMNGVVTQRGSSADRLQGPAELVAHLSRFFTLLPGDIVFTGAAPFVPGAEKQVRAGDELEAEIEGIGILRNRGVPMGGTPW